MTVLPVEDPYLTDLKARALFLQEMVTTVHFREEADEMGKSAASILEAERLGIPYSIVKTRASLEKRLEALTAERPQSLLVECGACRGVGCAQCNNSGFEIR
jgi:riboflavin biosynthesis pyrimidine reductase